MATRLGIDLGGTKIEILALDDAGTVRHRKRIATPQGNYAATVAALAGLVHEAEALVGPASVGVATPGAVSPHDQGRMKNANSTCLNGQPLKADLEAALGREVRLANDANCLALSEATDGAAAGAPIVFGVILGTGVGGGIAVDGRVLTGANAIAGEWGHDPLPWPRDDERPGHRCYCGREGCIETWLSGPGMARHFAERRGRALAPEEIVAHAAVDPACAQALADYEDRLARALASIINVLDPHVIVLGGGLSRIERLYSRVPAQWGRYIFSDHVATRLVPPRYGDASGARGAAWLWH